MVRNPLRYGRIAPEINGVRMYRIASIAAHVTHVATRIPFRYGIAEMTQAPHVVVELRVESPEGSADGWASEHLAPKWFTKNPNSAFEDDIRDMVAVIEHAVGVAQGRGAATPFDLWWQLQAAQQAWGDREGIPGLLSGLGSAIVERALVDAVCRLLGVPFADALRSGALGFDAGRIHPELESQSLHDAFPANTATTIAVRHTVGLSDPLTDDEVMDAPADDLPVSLDTIIARYGVTHFKVKTAGDAERDVPRLRRILELTAAHGVDPWFTIDGNESMTTADHLLDWGGALLADPALSPVLRERLIAVEQPFHRSIALGVDVGSALRAFELPVIIDESDDAVGTIRAAMDLGYAGGTYKGCKGVFRGLANAALVRHRGGTSRTVLTAEDLSTLPPLTVPQDLAVAHVCGLTHIERNGHHYFGRLAPLDPRVEDKAVAAHPDVYERQSDGRVRLKIVDGAIQLDTVLAAPFGFAPDLDVSTLAPLSADSAIAGLV
jgi:hypothetical protein